MADTGKFGGGRAAQFGDRISPGTGDGGHCAQCEAMLADALDGTLSSADQVLFDTHMATCGPCGDGPQQVCVRPESEAPVGRL